MPTTRKRIGFLPRIEVQSIIEAICQDQKLSQSKVTGILVEEALNARGLIENKGSNKVINHPLNKTNYKHTNQESMNNDIQMIKEYIEYKLFKKIMTEQMHKPK